MLTAAFDPAKVRRDFPMLGSSMNGRPLVYLDSAATTQKPSAVIDRMTRFLSREYATVRRGVYTFSQLTTEECDQVRERCRRFLGAAQAAEIVFTRGTTEAINLVASSFARKMLRPGDEILVSELEHHSNLVPWQQLCFEKGMTLRAIPVDDRGDILLDEFERMLGPRTYLVAVAHVSNAIGSVHPIREIVRRAHRAGAWVLVDGAQGAPHLSVDVRDLDCDFYCFSGHKIYGPTGVGVLYAKREHLEAMQPYQYGGDMIETVTFERTTFAGPPAKFEAGTPAITEIIGLGAALDYLGGLGPGAAAHERALLEEAVRALRTVPGLRLVGDPLERAGVVSFTLEGAHPHDVGTILDREGVAIRAGHHCAQPAMRRFGVTATCRASFGIYNDRDDVRALVAALGRVREVFR